MPPELPNRDIAPRDAIDWRLIEQLQFDGRASYESLAGEVGLSKVATRARVKKMLDAGAVRVVGVAHPSLLGMSYGARVSLDTVGPSLPIARTIAASVPGVVFVALSTGPRALVAELRLATLAEVAGAVRMLRSVPGVADCDTAVYTEIFRDSTLALNRPLVISPEPPDLAVMAALQHNGRLSFVELARVSEISPASVRVRLHRLIEHGAFSIRTLVTNAPDAPGEQAGFALDVRFDEQFSEQSVLAIDGVTFLAGAFGPSDLFGTIRGSSIAQIASIVETLREIPGVVRVRSWIHFQIVHENYERVLALPDPHGR